jgi:uncharacterized protein YgbK (DUF1537 family)
MRAPWLILADDLTGAADCGIVFAKHGRETVVVWGADAANSVAAAEAVSVDVDCRRFAAAEAVARQVAAQSAYWRDGVRLYKKIDSTLRGQPAAELAAQLRALRRDGKRAPLAVFAPAFPATGRVTIGGKVAVNGVPLEETPGWAREHTYANAFLPDILASAGLSCDLIDLATIRAGIEPVAERMRAAERSGRDAVACDCSEIRDLDVVARASLRLDQAMWVGSAGLAAALIGVDGPLQPASPVLMGEGAVLVVVGSLSEASRRQAAVLVENGLVSHVPIAPAVLFAGADGAQWTGAVRSLATAAAGGKPVLVEIAQVAGPDLTRGAELAGYLAKLVETAVPRIAALVATGGETACALLSRFGVTGIRLVDEVEPGVPLGVTLGTRAMPVITKAGGFGDADTLRRSLAKLGVQAAAR